MMWLNALLEALGRRRGRPFRIPCNLPARTHASIGAVAGRAVNLSNRGLKLRMPQALETDEEVVIRLLGNKNPQNSISVKARVIWSRKRGRSIDMGMEVTGFGESQYDDVVQFFRDEVKLEVHETASRLRSPRVLQAYPLRFSAFGQTRSIKGVVQNISATGVRFLSEEQATPGEQLQVTLELPHTRQSLTLHATVRRSKMLPSGNWDVAAIISPEGSYNRDLLRAELARLSETNEGLQ